MAKDIAKLLSHFIYFQTFGAHTQILLRLTTCAEFNHMDGRSRGNTTQAIKSGPLRHCLSTKK